MPSFDLKAFATVQSFDQNLVNSVGAAYGVPDCLLSLTNDALALIPSDILGQMKSDLQDGQSVADEHVKSVYDKLRNELGIVEWDSESGRFKLISKASKNGQDASKNNWFTNALGYMNGIATAGADLYDTVQDISAYIDEVKDCVNGYLDYLKFSGNNSRTQGLALLPASAVEAFNEAQYAAAKEAVAEAENFIINAKNQINKIDSILLQRQDDNFSLFSCSAINYLSGTSYVRDCEIIKEEGDAEIFRLVYGPPKSTLGQFILSEDGIYFNSTTSGILPALTHIQNKKNNIPKSLLWKFDYAPNLGGRGDDFSIENLKLYINTILDPTKVNDSTDLKIYYDKDGFLQELIGNRNKRLYDLSSQLSELETENAPISIIYNHKQSILSESNIFREKINKRKKQIELAVLLPRINNSPNYFMPGEIPVNNFSYLSELNIPLDLQKQKSLLFSQIDISGVVSPIQTKSTNSLVAQLFSKNKSVEHLIISDLGDGAIIYDGSSVSSTNSTVLQVENTLTTDSLIALYNFLDTSITEPSSTIFNVRNSISPTNELYAQLVANNTNDVFKNGLGIPYLHGITKNNNTDVSALGSFVRLPESSKFNDLFYNKNGATIDFWIHVPNLTELSGYNSNTTSSLYRLVLANENSGGQDNIAQEYSGSFGNQFGTERVRGLLLGFTRDRRLCSSQGPSNSDQQNPISESVFFIAPTQSLGPNLVSFINRGGYDGIGCLSDNSYHGMMVRLDKKSQSDIALSSIQNEFCHMAVSFDYYNDTISVYKDGELLETSSLSYSFGLPERTPLTIPTFHRLDSFRYNSQNLNTNAPDSLKEGPKLDRYFTPWIVGGGFTDGMANGGNFMGGNYGGLVSGLRGFLGSIKFYSKSLQFNDVLNNYKVHKDFFKNIDISSLE